MTDSELEAAIKNRIDSNAELREAKLDVDADAKTREATLSGTVPTQPLRERAVELAKTTQPGLTVKDHIKVEPPTSASANDRTSFTEELARAGRERAKSAGEKVGDSIDDAWIHTKITSKMMADTDTPSRKINVDVVDNAVTLRGEVSTQAAKSEAERIARETDGVKKVTNLLRVRPSSS
jgi:osmotically-inducible protein OsmY